MGSSGTGSAAGRGRDLFPRGIPPGFEARRIVVDCGVERPYEETEWLDALVLVEEGEIELECVRGSRHRFGRGDMFWLVGLPLRVIRCAGPGQAVLIAVTRPAADEFPARPPSETE